MLRNKPGTWPKWRSGKTLRNAALTAALWATLLTWVWCGPQSWKWKEKTPPKTEQNDGREEGYIVLKQVTRTVKENWDWTYSVYSTPGGEKISWDYNAITWSKNWSFIWEKIIDWKTKFRLLNEAWLEISDYYDWIENVEFKPAESQKLSEDILAKWPGEFSFIATIDGKKVFIKNWEEASWHYDRLTEYSGGFIWVIWEKVYFESDWVVSWPFDDIFDINRLEDSESDKIIFAKNNWKNEFYYQWKCLLSLPLSLSNDECAIILNSFHFEKWKLCYSYPDNWHITIVLWDNVLKTKYSYVENIQLNEDWTIIYVWYNEDDIEDWIPTRVYIVTWNNATVVDYEKDWQSTIDEVLSTESSLLFYTTYWYFKQISYAWETSQWDVYVVWNNWWREQLAFNGKIIWNEYDHISWAWLIEWWWIYVRWERDGKNYIVINWKESEDISKPGDPARNLDLFSRC